jgi:hypothetical protein
MKIIIFAYNRPDALLELLHELKGYDITVIDDHSAYDPTEHMKLCEYIRTPPRRKYGFWKQWQFAFDICRNSKHEYFLFIPDDYYDIDMAKLKRIKSTKPFMLHPTNFGTKKMWTNIQPQPATFCGISCLKVGFVDCTFYTNRITLELMEWTQPEVGWDWFVHKDMSSGVGWSQSHLLEKLEIPIYLPDKVLAHHGKWDSVMHPEHRKEIPLIC